MSIKYFFEFKGIDNVLNRCEIHTSESVLPKEIKGYVNPFILEYLDASKLDPIQGSQSTLGLISESIFQFIDLHTDNMQEFKIKFFRSGQLYWIGYLDSELYAENLSDYPPYPVEFSGADFNIMERLKFTDNVDKPYIDIVPMIGQLKRCFDKLGLPFLKLYIGCSTIPEAVPLLNNETVLHRMYIQSSNFYDEDGEPMSCREVLESILSPFGLMMVQRDGSVFIYDYNTVKTGGNMKSYDFATLAYTGDVSINYLLGDISMIGMTSTEGSFGFEGMINNVIITSSLYASGNVINYEVKETLLEKLYHTSEQKDYILKTYLECKPWVAESFLLYKSLVNDSTLIGASFKYTADSSYKKIMTFIGNDNYLIYTGGNFYINIKASAYINTKKNPFDESVNEADERTRIMRMYCNLILLDDADKPIMYYDNFLWKSEGWKNITGQTALQEARFILDFGDNSLATGRIANKWLINSKVIRNPISGKLLTILEEDFQKGIDISTPPSSGYIRLQMLYCLITDNETALPGFPQVFPKDKVVNMLINDTELSLVDADRKKASTDDYEFKSYINKKVISDYPNITLKCVSANEEKAPMGKANILKRANDQYELQLLFSRSGETNILERLLMRTIHSNFSNKNKLISANLKLGENPILRYVTYNSVLQSNGMYIIGAKIDFDEARITIKAVEFSSDTYKLSDIPYE